MKNEKLNAELVWKQLEDQLAPRLRLSLKRFAFASDISQNSVHIHISRRLRIACATESILCAS